MSVILVFVDGLGVGVRDRSINPCASEGVELLSHFQEEDFHPLPANGIFTSIDANCDVDGLPQSASGQTTLLSGVNASQLLGRHLPGYPTPKLREVLRGHSILKQVRDLGLEPRFINAFRPLFFRLNEETQWRLSATTVATLAAGVDFFRIEDVQAGKSIYHDFTNTHLQHRGFDVPTLTPESAAGVLADASRQYDFVLYEYFMTDRAGHKQDMEKAILEIKKVDQFMKALVQDVDLNETTILLTSDHGNIEDLSVKTHTRNRAMTLIWGPCKEFLHEKLQTLMDVTPGLIRCLNGEGVK